MTKKTKKDLPNMARKKNVEKWICWLGYIMVPLFFVILYCLMTQTIEDLMQGNSVASMSLGENLNRTYESIPRLGEFYQYVAVQHMTPQVTFGVDIIFRLITAVVASGVVYFATFFVLGRRPKLQYKDMIIYVGTFLLMMVSDFSDVFTHRFSHANNYAFALLVSIVFMLLFRMKVKDTGWWRRIGVILLGFLFGISTEVTPIAFLLLAIAWAIFGLCRCRFTLRGMVTRYKLQIVAMIGVVIGLIFFHLGGSLYARLGGLYAERYGYIGLEEIFAAPLTGIYTLIQHFWFNVRYVIYAIIMMAVFVLAEATALREKKSNYLLWQLCLLGYAIIFVVTSSVVHVDDDLYIRFMSPLLMAIVLSVGLFVWHLLEQSKITQRVLKWVSIILIGGGMIMALDMTYAFAKYHQEITQELNTAMQYTEDGELEIVAPNAKEFDMKHSPLFDFYQLSPLRWE